MKQNIMKSGLKALITGASTGIGKALSLQLAKEYQAKLILNARGTEDLENTAEEARKLGSEVLTICGDISSETVIENIARAIEKEFSGLDLLVNNAGLARQGEFTALKPEDWQYVFEVNFFAALKLIYKTLPLFLEQGSGKIVNVASVAGKISFPGSVCYASSKFALCGLSEGMAAEFAGKIDVITVCPGWVRTEFFKKNKTAEDPSAISQEKSLKGWLMKNILSISSEEVANDIVKALKQGGSHELIMTAPGVLVERLSALFPHFTAYLTSHIPANRGRIN